MSEEKESKSSLITDLRAKLLQDRTIEFADKIVKHQLKKDLLQSITESIQQKKKILEEEEQNLEEIQENIYELEDKFCESVSKFSKEHNFGNFLINYPRVKVPPACNCELYKETALRIEKQLQENAEIQELTHEVDVLKLEFETLQKDKNLEEEIKKSSEKLKFASDEDSEIERLTKVLQKSQQELESLQTEIEKYLQKEDLLSENVEIYSSPTREKRKITDGDKSSKKLKSIKKTPRVIKTSLLIRLNTIDNYLILKRCQTKPVELAIPQNEDEKFINELKKTNEIKSQDISEILNSWTHDSDGKTKTFTTEQSRIKSLMAEQNSISKSFTPKKLSVISEKLLKIKMDQE